MSTNPRQLGKYELQVCLGRGGMAEVWKSFDTQLKRFVAIKILRAELQADPSFVAGFEREAQLIASLHHPNIVQIHDFSVTRPPEAEHTILYMVMHYIEGSSLASFIRRTSRLGQFPSPATIVQLFTPLSLAIDYAHEQGMIHRDIKPSNILLDQRNTAHHAMGGPILTDFGIAKLLGGASGTGSGGWLATPAYMAPEQVMGAPGDERSDIYALGVILYEICTGVRPFQGETSTEIMRQHLNAAPPAPMLINPAIPPALAGVILRALAKDPTMRFPTASALVAALAEAFNMPIPEALNVPRATEALSSPTHLSPLSSHLLSNGISSSGSLPVAPPSNPLLSPPMAAPRQAAADNGQQSSEMFTGTMPRVPLSPASRQLPALGSLQPSVNIVRSGSSSPPLTRRPSAPPSSRRRGKRRRWRFIGLTAALLLVVVCAGLGAFSRLPQSRESTPRQLIVGHAFFISSGRIDEGSSQGIMDELQLNLFTVPNPGPGKSYYGWLEPDSNQTMTRAPVLLGKLPVTNGTIAYLYRGDAQHTNLLALMSRFLITEEDAAVQPTIPSPDISTWRYAAQFPQSTGPLNSPQNSPGSMSGMKNLTVLDHLRHLLAEAPELQASGLPGGLDIWLFRNTEKVLGWSVSARDDWQTKNYASLHRHVVRILDYLDGLSFVQQDAPGEPVYVVPINGKIGLLDVDPRMMAHGFLYTIDVHLNALIQSPGSTPNQRRLAIKIDTAVKNVQTWLTNVRKDAQQLEDMTDAQLAQPTTRDNLLDPMSDDALSAFSGRLDPETGNVQEGVTQLHYDIQRLATFDIQPYAP